MLRGRDDDRHAAVPKRLQQVADHPFGQFLVVTVELNGVMTDVQVFSRNHRFSICEARLELAAYLPTK